MQIYLDKIFFSTNDYIKAVNELNEIFDKYCYNSDELSFKIENNKLMILDEHDNHLVTEKIVHKEKLSHRFVDIIEISIRYFVKYKKNKEHLFLNFVNEISNLLLSKAHIFGFEFVKFDKENNIHCLYFKFEDVEYKIMPRDNYTYGGIYIINLYTKINDNEYKLLFKKPVYRYGNIIIDLLYYMISFIHHIMNFIKGNEIWDKA